MQNLLKMPVRGGGGRGVFSAEALYFDGPMPCFCALKGGFCTLITTGFGSR